MSRELDYIMTVENNCSLGKLGKSRYLVLGIDPGIASCGFALLDLNNHEILEMGSRLFDPPVVPKTKQSKAVVRRGFRSTRRNLNRTKGRLKHCLNLLKDADIVPQDATAEFFHSIKGDKQPIQLRADGLDRTLTDREWALVLYSLCKRRGYIPHGENDADSASEDGKVLKAIAQNNKILKEGSYRTVGEWLNSLDRSRNRAGAYDKCVTHEQLSHEVQTLFSQQRQLGNNHASKELEQKYFEIFNWQKPKASFDEKSYALVGNCVYFPEEKRAARCTLTSEMVSAYGALGNVTICQADHSTRTLNAKERDHFIEILFSPLPIKGNKTCKVTFSSIRKYLDLSARDEFKGIKLEDEKNREVYIPKGWQTLRKVLETNGENLLIRLRNDRDLADSVFEAFAYASASDVLYSRLEQLDLNQAEINLLMKVPYNNKALNGYGSRSKKALDILLESFVEPEILTLTEAEYACGLYGLRQNTNHRVEPKDNLMPYSSWLAITGGTNNNPVVLRAMAQMRKVVNAICNAWGVPNEIHVELDRELAQSKKTKQAIEQAIRKNELNNKRIRAQISELTGKDVDAISSTLVTKWRLWEEQDNKDIYTGDQIDSERLLKDDTYTQIDHILPFSRTGDNSKHNKVLVLSHSNQDKRERSPYEWMTSDDTDTPDWSAFTARVLENHKISRRKRDFLLETNLKEKENEFQKKNLVDTRYMSREVFAYLTDCLAFPEDGKKNHVVPVKGQANSWLRHAWHLNFGITGEKDRSDDRHHATDACVIAACSRSLVIKTAHFSERKRYIKPEKRAEMLAEAKPWPSFTEDVAKKREQVIPTRFVPRKAGGQLFEQTVYSYIGTDKAGKDLLKNKAGEAKPAGNAIVLPNGKAAVKVGDMLCLRLWHDPLARKGKGQWYADPVYRADLPALQKGIYIPKIAKAHCGRKTWEIIPESALKDKPIVIYFGCVIRVDNQVGRFAGLNIDSVKWKMVDVLTGKEIKFPTIGSLTNQIIPQVITEDILGRCWLNL